MAADDAVRAAPSAKVELDRIAASRSGFLPLTALPSLPCLPSEAVALLASNAENVAWIKTLVDNLGWPGRSCDGEEGADCAWMLVLHADRDRQFQERCLSLLAEAVELDEADPRHYAFLADRLRRAVGRAQLYGTLCALRDGAIVFTSPVDDEPGLAARRRLLGLPDIATDEAALRAGDSLIPYPPYRKHPANQWPARH